MIREMVTIGMIEHFNAKSERDNARHSAGFWQSESIRLQEQVNILLADVEKLKETIANIQTVV